MKVMSGKVRLEGLDQGADVGCKWWVAGLADCYSVLVFFDKHLK